MLFIFFSFSTAGCGPEQPSKIALFPVPRFQNNFKFINNKLFLFFYRTSQMTVFVKHMTTQHPDEPTLLVQPQNMAANITKPNVAIQPMVGAIIPPGVLPYSFNPMILNIPNAQNLKPVNEQSNGVVSMQNVASNQGLLHYQQTTLVPLNFYWGAQS